MLAQKELQIALKKHEKEKAQMREHLQSLELRLQHQDQQRATEWSYFTRKVSDAAQIPVESLQKPLLNSNGDKVSEMQQNVFELVKSLKNRDFTHNKPQQIYPVHE